MKTSLTTIILLLFAQMAVASSGGLSPVPFPYQSSGGGGPTYIIDQNFEGTGYDNSETWSEFRVESQGIVNEDYTTLALVGSQSLYLESEDYRTVSAYISITPTGDVYFFLIVRVVGAVGTNASPVLILYDGSSIPVLEVKILSNSVISLNSGGDVDYSSVGITADTTTYMWGSYHAGTGSDSTADLYVATSDTKPGAATASITGGDETADVETVSLSARYDCDTIVDHLLVDDVDIGSAP